MVKGNKFKAAAAEGSKTGVVQPAIGTSGTVVVISDRPNGTNHQQSRRSAVAALKLKRRRAPASTIKEIKPDATSADQIPSKKPRLGKSGAARKQLARAKRRAAEEESGPGQAGKPIGRIQTTAFTTGKAHSAQQRSLKAKSSKSTAMRTARRKKASAASAASTIFATTGTKSSARLLSCSSTAKEPKSEGDLRLSATTVKAKVVLAQATTIDTPASRAGNATVALASSPVTKTPHPASPSTTAQEHGMVVAVAGSNWAALKAQLSTAPHRFRQHKKRQRDADEAAATATEAATVPKEARSVAPEAISHDSSLTTVVAVDCEMVGVGPDGIRSELARVCIVNNHGTVLLDQFAKPKERVTDFRTRYSGIRPGDIRSAPSFDDVQRQAAAILTGRTIVGHSISNDLKALLLGHPGKHIRDTARFPPLMLPRRPGGKARARALRELAAEQLGLTIQEGEHSPVDDARAALYLYHKYKKEWEAELKQHGSTKRMKSLLAGTGRRAAARSLADLARNDCMVDL